jgi:hypothetical protein
MNMREISAWRFASSNSAERHRSRGPAQFGQRAVSRRQFTRQAAGAAVVGAALGSGWWRPGLAEAHSAAAPRPIPGGTPLLGGGFHLFGPTADGSFDPIDAEPSTITDFNGFVGLAYIDGTVERTNEATGEVLTLPFLVSDMRFMQGAYKSRNGRVREGTFALV